MPYTFDFIRQRYLDPQGRPVTDRAMQDAITASLANVGRYTDALASQLREGEISLAVWRVEMQTVIKQVNLMGGALAIGGFDALGPDDMARLEDKMMEDFLYLEAWASELQDGEAPMDGRMGSRARLYVNQGRVVFHEERDEAVRAQGFDEVRSILHPAEHCDLCVEQADRGWMPLDEFIPIGERTCLSNDKCTVEYRRGAQAEASFFAAGGARRRQPVRRAAPATATAEAPRRPRRPRVPAVASATVREAEGTVALPPDPLPDRPRGDRSPLASDYVIDRLRSSGLISPRAFVAMGDDDISDPDEVAGLIQTHFHIPVGRGQGIIDDPAGLVLERPSEWDAGPLSREDAERMNGIIVGTLEDLERRYPGFAAHNNLDLLFLRRHEGGVTISPWSREKYERDTALFPADYPRGIMSVQDPQASVGNLIAQAKQHEADPAYPPFAMWAATEAQARDTDGIMASVARHESAHLMTNAAALVEWEAALRRARVPGTFTPTTQEVSEAKARARRQWMRGHLGQYAASGTSQGPPDGLLEEIAEAAAWVSSPDYTPGTLPAPIEEYIARLYRGEFATMEAPRTGYYALPPASGELSRAALIAIVEH